MIIHQDSKYADLMMMWDITLFILSLKRTVAMLKAMGVDEGKMSIDIFDYDR